MTVFIVGWQRWWNRLHPKETVLLKSKHVAFLGIWKYISYAAYLFAIIKYKVL